MRIAPLFHTLLMCAAFSLPAGIALAADPDTDSGGRVTVTMVNPDQFTEVKQNGNRGDVRDGSWLERLRKYVVAEAGKRLPPGDTLDVRITDIKRAGDFEPWHGPQLQDVRFMKDVYPPRIDLSYTLKGADGSVIGEGDKALRDPGFMNRGVRRSADDPLRYEKRLIDDWLADILPRAKS